jgi:hypothetical protein
MMRFFLMEMNLLLENCFGFLTQIVVCKNFSSFVLQGQISAIKVAYRAGQQAVLLCPAFERHMPHNAYYVETCFFTVIFF